MLQLLVLFVLLLAGCGLDSPPNASLDDTVTSRHAEDASSDVRDDSSIVTADGPAPSVTDDATVPPLGDDSDAESITDGASDGSDGGSLPGVPDGASLLFSNALGFLGVTADGYVSVLVSDGGKTSLLATKSDGASAPITILSDVGGIDTAYAKIAGRYLFFWDNCASPDICRLTIWSAAGPPVELSNSIGGLSVMSGDGSIALVTHDSAPALTSTVALLSTADAAIRDISPIDLSCVSYNPDTFSQSHLLDLGEHRFIVASCDATISVFSLPLDAHQAPRLIRGGGANLQMDGAGDTITFTTYFGQFAFPTVLDLKTGAPVPGSTVLNFSTNGMALSRSGDFVFVQNATDYTIYRFSVHDGSLVPVVAGALDFVLFDEQTLYFSTRYTINGGSYTGYNLFLAAAPWPASAQPVSTRTDSKVDILLDSGALFSLRQPAGAALAPMRFWDRSNGVTYAVSEQGYFFDHSASGRVYFVEGWSLDSLTLVAFDTANPPARRNIASPCLGAAYDEAAKRVVFMLAGQMPGLYSLPDP